MKHLIIGDIHGFHRNLFSFLRANNVIDKKGNAINRDEFKVYCVGDLIDGNYNRQGDILNLERAEEWFDGVCLGNHEFAFIGGKDFGTRRKHDRKTMNLLLGLIDKGIYAPSFLIKDTLLTHSGVSEKFAFDNAKDTYEYIRVMWELSTSIEDEIAIFDWSTPNQYGYSYVYTGSTGGIFELDWSSNRNSSFNQIVGHSTYYTGPIRKAYPNGNVHWNIDVGGKTGKCVGGIIYDDVTDDVEVTFWGSRHEDGFSKAKKTIPLKGEVVTFDPKTTMAAVGQQNLQTTIHGSQSGKELVLSGSTPKMNMNGSEELIKVKLTSLDDIDISVVDDPDILSAYRNEIQKGNHNLKLKDYVGERFH